MVEAEDTDIVEAEDVIGMALLGWWNGDHRTPLVVERDDGHRAEEALGDYIMGPPWPAEMPLVGQIAGRVLDIGCGGGRHLMPLVAAGMDATGLDASPGAIRVCRLRKAQKLIEGRIGEVELPEAGFDTMLLFGNGIGLGGSPDGLRQMLERLRRALAPGGQILAGGRDVRGTDNPVHVRFQEANRAKGLRPGQMRIRLCYGAAVGPWFDWLHPTPNDLAGFAVETGLRITQIARRPGSKGGPYGAILRREEDA